ncbi:hypothetical protein ABTX81_30685 [Kitasatospora sp. NPDC097605]|uniref:hypothetical protein n=1 Tax=Kitasatospora sp. NPDC097605 TaxID=3157226 RepID=UPI00331D7608
MPATPPRQRPTVRDLEAAYTALLSTPDLTPERARQYTAVMNEVRRAVQGAGRTLPARAALTDDALDAFFAAAEDGQYRTAPRGEGETAKVTNRVRIGCINALSDLAGRPLALAHRSAAPAARPGLTPHQARALRAYTDRQNQNDHLDPDHRRIVLAFGLVLDTKARSGELAAMLTSDLDEKPGTDSRPPIATAILRLNPQRRPSPERIPTTPIDLHPYTRDSLSRWLPERERLVAELRAWHRQHPDQDVDPHHDFLFVSLKPNHTGGTPSPEGGTPLRPAGMPLEAQGFRRALIRAAHRIAADRARQFNTTAARIPPIEQLRKVV